MSNESVDVKNPKPAEHSDNEASKMPDRADDDRKQAPSDKPGKKPGRASRTWGEVWRCVGYLAPRRGAFYR